jgi:hypothetical protein
MPTPLDRKEELALQYRKLADRLSESDARTVDFLRGQAVSYVWGRQDAGESGRDTAYSNMFGYAYGIQAARFVLGEIGTRTTIENAFLSFRNYGAVAN